MRKFTIDVSEVKNSLSKKSVVRLSIGDCGMKVSVSWVYTTETVEQVLQNKEYYQRVLIQQITDNVSWEES